MRRMLLVFLIGYLHATAIVVASERLAPAEKLFNLSPPSLWQRLTSTHPTQAGGLPTGSAMYEAPGGAKLIVIPGGYLLTLYDDQMTWVMTRVLSPALQRHLDELVPVGSANFLTTRPARPLTSEQEEALLKIVETIGGLYCAVNDDLIRSLSAGTNPRGFTEDDLRRGHDRSREREKIARMNARRRELYDPSTFPQETRLVVVGDRLFNVNSCGVVLHELEWVWANQDVRRWFFRTAGQQGHLCQTHTPEVAHLFLGTHRIAQGSIPEVEIRLAEDVLTGLDIRTDCERSDDDEAIVVDPPGRSIDDDRLDEPGLLRCPPDLASGTFGLDIEERDANTYLLTLGEDLARWVLVTGQACNRCGTTGEGFTNQIISPELQRPLRIRRMFDLAVLVDSKLAERKTRAFRSLSRLLRFARTGRLPGNEVLVLGEAGFAYEAPNGEIILSLDGVEARCPAATRIEARRFRDWLSKMARKQAPPVIEPTTGLTRQLVQEIALGERSWSVRFRQNPLAFLSNDCPMTAEPAERGAR